MPRCTAESCGAALSNAGQGPGNARQRQRMASLRTAKARLGSARLGSAKARRRFAQRGKGAAERCTAKQRQGTARHRAARQRLGVARSGKAKATSVGQSGPAKPVQPVVGYYMPDSTMTTRRCLGCDATVEKPRWFCTPCLKRVRADRPAKTAQPRPPRHTRFSSRSDSHAKDKTRNRGHR